MLMGVSSFNYYSLGHLGGSVGGDGVRCAGGGGGGGGGGGECRINSV